MQTQDWIEIGWRLFCPRAELFWKAGIREVDQEPISREIQWYENEEDTDREIDWADPSFGPEEENGDPVFRALAFPPTCIWVGAFFCFLSLNGMEMGVLKTGTRELIVKSNPKALEKALENPESKAATLSRCGICPYYCYCRGAVAGKGSTSDP